LEITLIFRLKTLSISFTYVNALDIVLSMLYTQN